MSNDDSKEVLDQLRVDVVVLRHKIGQVDGTVIPVVDKLLAKLTEIHRLEIKQYLEQAEGNT